ncbi:MAG: hypothetical protein GXP10_03830, partial [Gammaproteobacteria bacterium]|nr:hypothetical protein [Gammaproteobacteria bacterium]
MQLHRDTDYGIYAINAYSAGELIITPPFGVDCDALPGEKASSDALDRRRTLRQSAIITLHEMVGDWPPQTFSELQAQHLAQLIPLKPELVLLGTGPSCQIPATALTAPLIEAGIGVEFMDTGAACRTYNLLTFDGR